MSIEFGLWRLDAPPPGQVSQTFDMAPKAAQEHENLTPEGHTQRGP